MNVVDVFTITDAQIDAATAARRANPEPPRTDDAYWLAVIARREQAAREAERKALAALHRCSRCGIDTTRPDLCLDCVDVLALEAS